MTDPVSIKIELPDTPPSKVPRLTLSLDGTTVTLEWSEPVDDGGSPITGYILLRGLSRDDLSEMAEVGPDVTSWTDEGLEKGSTYYYSGFAKNEVGDGEPIAVKEVKVPKPKKDNSPGFEIALVALAFLLAVMLVRRRF